MSHDNIDFVPQIPFLFSEGFLSPFDPQKYIFFLLPVKFSIDGYIHDHTDFGPQIPFLGSEGLFSPF
jgi:hypothetical protein